MREELRGILQAYYIGIGGNVSWGNILGDIENQIDLMNQFDTKVPVARELTINGVTHNLSSNRSWTIATPDLSSYVPYTGASGDVNLGEYELKAGQIEYDQTPTGAAGVAITRWNDSIGTLETTLKGGNVVLKHGRDLFERVVNKTGIQLTKAAYQAVRVSTAQGQRLGVALAQANNDNNSADTIGLVVETIDNNQEGMIYVVGEINGINTTGSLQSETWADGDVLYLSPTTAGRITNVKPIAPQHLVVIGYVVYSHATQGKIYVKVINGFELGELHDVDTTGATNGQVLKYNGTIWTAQTDSGTPSGVAGAIQFSNGSAFASDATNFFWDDANNRLGIGINVPTATLNIKGSGTTTTFSQINTDSAGNDTFQVRDDGCVKIGGGSFGHPANTRFQVNNGSTGVLRLDTTTIYVPDTISTLNNSVLTIEGNSSGLVLQPINGNLGTVNIGGGKVNNASYSSQTKKLLQLNQGWTSVAPSLDLTINSLELNNAIDMTNGTGTKIFRGIYHNPTITGVTDHRAFQSSSGGGYFNTSAVDASAVLQADSTTQGFLMPRMTGIQVEGISTPSEGLIVYALSAGVASVTSKGIYHYTGSTWEKINGGGGGGSTFADNVFEIYDNTDNTKKLAFEASGITTGTTRTLTVPNASGTIALTSDLASYVPYTGATGAVNLGANNLTVDTNVLFADATNNRVGLGTATPYNTLTVSSNGTSYSNAGFISQFYQGTNNTDVKIMMADASNFISITYGGTTTSNTQWAGFTMGSGNAAFRVWGSDNVGIGFTNGNLVTNKFQVSGNSRFDGLLRFATDTSAAVALKRNGTELQVRLADDSGFAPIQALGGTFNGTFTVGSNSIYSPSGSTKVSFGTTVQNYQFTLYATGNDNRLHFLNNTTGTAVTDGTFMGLDDGINFSFWQRENGYIRIGTNETERLRITGAGLVGIGTTAPAAILHANSSGGATDLFRVDLAGVRRLRITSTGSVGLISNNTGFYEGTSTGFDFSNTNAPAATQSAYNFYGRTSTNATGESTHFDMGGKNIAATTGFARSSGTGSWIGGRLDYTINNTGTYSGTVTGFYLNATETSITGTTHNLLNLLVGGSSMFRVNNTGVVSINTGITDASAQLQVDSTTKGFLMPRMTTTQRDAIATPATGLEIYNTTTNSNNFYNGTAWEDIKLINTNRQNASYTLVLTDADKLVEMNVGSANNLTIPLDSSVPYTIGTQILIAQYGAGQTTVVATSGVTIRSSGGKLKLNAQYSGATLIKIAQNEWYLFGDIAA